jgi:F420-0:gamma-glutamyl ligase
LEASKKNNFSIQNNDVLAITEAVVSICQGNYATIDDIAQDILNKFKSEHI